VGQEQHVAQPHGSVAIVLRELIGVEFRERFRETLLYLRRDRTLLALLLEADDVRPVDREKLRHLVRTLDHLLQNLGHERAVLFACRHRAHEEKRRMAQLHLCAGVDRDLRNHVRRDLRHQRLDAIGDRLAVLVELILPKHAVHHRPAKLGLRPERARRRAFMRSRLLEALEDVEFCHDGALLGLRRD
jgi:hypothetical protein